MLYLLGLRIEHSTEAFDFWSVFSCVIPANTVSAYLIIEVLCLTSKYQEVVYH